MSETSPLYAGFWRRAGGAAIDALVLMVPSEALRRADFGISEPWVDFAVWTLASWIYYAWSHSSKYQATVGQHAFGMRITDLRGNRISFARASARFAASWLSTFLLLMGYLMAAWSRHKQTLHDRIAGTVVIGKAVASWNVESGGVMPMTARTRFAVATWLLIATAMFFASFWFAYTAALDDGSVPVSSASPGKEESLSYAIYTLPFLSGDPQLSGEGTRRYRHSDVRVTRYPDSELHMMVKTLEIANGYAVEATIYPDERLDGFGLSLKKDGGGFSWEWFDREADDVFRKRQGTGRVKVRYASGSAQEELAEVLFLDDVTMRLNRYWLLPFRHRDSDQVVVKRGSVLWLAD